MCSLVWLDGLEAGVLSPCRLPQAGPIVMGTSPLGQTFTARQVPHLAL